VEGENLVLKAARELEGRVGQALPFTIRLFKRIPMGAGLGGGSADAAAFLRAADQLYDLRLKHDELVEIGAAVGQDVPFFLSGGTARAMGLGSTVEPLPPVPTTWWFLVVCPPIQVSTHAVYEAVDGKAPTARRTPVFVELLNTPSPALPTRGREKESPLTEGREKEGLPIEGREGQLFGNDLEPVSRRLFPALDNAIERLRSVIPNLAMSGTGASMFAVFASRREAEDALASVKPLGYPAWMCRPIAAPSPTLPTRGRESVR
jgi:4-diphosphocytidyl-2-C-methyl-D-erythritol kinase